MTLAIDVYESLTVLKRQVADVKSYASANSFSIDRAGTVIDLAPDLEDPGVRDERKTDIEQTVAEVVRQGQAIESMASGGLGVVADGAVDDGGATSVGEAVASPDVLRLPPQGASADECKVWWDSLTENEQTKALDDHYREIGNLPGLPLRSRVRRTIETSMRTTRL